MFRIILLMALMLLQPSNANNRLIYLYVKDANNGIYQEQLKELQQNKPGLEDRDILIEKVVFSKTTLTQFGKHHVTSAFTIILLGKDGGEKYRSTEFTSAKKLFSFIDAMPMRRDEMRRKKP